MAQQGAPTFISYSREDLVFVLQLSEDLRTGGANIWFDQTDIAPGQDWARAIESAIREAPRMLLILSLYSVESKSLRNELSLALEENKTVLPILYQNCSVPLQLRGIQYIDFKDDYAEGLAKLLNALGLEEDSIQPQPTCSSQRHSTLARPVAR